MESASCSHRSKRATILSRMTTSSAPSDDQSTRAAQERSDLQRPVFRAGRKRQIAAIAAGVLWVAVALLVLVNQPLTEAVDAQSGALAIAITVTTWAVWLVGLFAIAIAAPICLTAWRLIAPLNVAAAVWIITAVDTYEWSVIALVTCLALASVVVTSGEFAQRAINGMAFKNEQRFLLRAPGAFALAPLPLMCAITSISSVGAILTVADQRWLLGAISGTIALFSLSVALKVIHTFSERWAVVVPAGLVIRDPLVLNDTVLAPFADITSFGPAPLGSDALDLTENALGLALQLQLSNSTFVAKRDLRRRTDAGYHATGMLIAPISPAELLASVKLARTSAH
jgi:hypothetical protein